jgi:hypothetical protein
MGLQVAQKLLVGHGRFGDPFGKGFQIFLIFAQGLAHRFVDEIGNRPVGRRRLQAQGLVKGGIEIDGGSLREFGHPGTSM